MKHKLTINNAPLSRTEKRWLEAIMNAALDDGDLPYDVCSTEKEQIRFDQFIRRFLPKNHYAHSAHIGTEYET